MPAARIAAAALRRATAAGGVALGVLAGALIAAPAAGAAPEAVTDFVTDRADALSAAEEERLEERLATLARADHLPELYVVFVDRFTDPSDPLAWVDDVAAASTLGSNQYLLAVGTEDRAMAVSRPNDGPLSQGRVDEIQDLIASRHFADEEWAAGVELAADEFEKRPWPWWVWVLGLAAIALIVALVVLLVRGVRELVRRRAELRTLEGRKRLAARELVRADTALRNSAQEVDFVRAEFDDATAAPFAAVVDSGRERLAGAFELQRLLEDTQEDTADQTRSWTDEILATCSAVLGELDAKRAALKRLRNVVADVGATHARLTEERRGADALVADAERQIAALASAHDAAAIAFVADNAEEMRLRLADVDEWLEKLRTASGAGQGRAITAAVHEIETDLAEVRELHDDIAEHARVLATGVSAPDRDAFTPTPGADGALAAAEQTLARAYDVVRGAREAVAARGDGVPRSALSQLNLAEVALRRADASRADPVAVEADARTAMERAEMARRFAGSRPSAFARAPRRFMSDEVEPARSRRTSYDDDSDGSGGRAAFGAVTGGVVGAISAASAADEAGGGIIVLGLVLGAVVGALSGLFGGGSGGGSSSGGWSSRSSGSFSSRGSFGRSRGGSGGGGSRGGGRSSSGRRF